MYCDGTSHDTENQPLPMLNCLNSAMRKLEMLSTIVNSRNQYLHDMRRKSFGSKPNTYVRKDASQTDLSVIQMNTRYVSNVTIGLRMKKTTNNRMMPYTVPERNRTKSENSDSLNLESRDFCDFPVQDTWMEHSSSYISVLDPKVGNTFTKDKKPTSLKKARSLEDIRVENIDASQPSHEMEFVSSRIQKLKVME
ncbi:uncharacterized protein LOC143921354 isoform X2 [Arctopsyche grandis]|uniref:uncharacterized protein LOC143921354 isoform X2 n=1 Tax=Arctopsyche grandis TaxID=121162 RepID=UPI00406D88B4